MFNLVFAVCHPDDEALWIGGLLCELSRIPFIRAHVICLSGSDPASPRMQEFEAARIVAGYQSGIILGFPLRPAPDPLPNTARTLEDGLATLGLKSSDVDLLITHSHYGDEHKHPHHVQAHHELRSWSLKQKIPFGFFSCIPLYWLQHVPAIFDLRRKGTLQLLNMSHCAPIERAPRPYGATAQSPVYYLQFLTDIAAKLKMLRCYPSINLDQHEHGYAMFTSGCEAIYLSDDRGLQPWLRIMEAMEIPGAKPLIVREVKTNIAVRVARKLKHMLTRSRM